MRARAVLAVACATALSAGCSAYDTRYEFEPRPLEYGHVLEGTADRAASTLVSVVGVRKRDADEGIVPSVELRLRVDNHTDQEVRLDPATLRLFAANLEPFPPPQGPAEPLVVAPRDTATLTVYFPFPDGRVPGPYDLAGLSARWTLEVGGQPSTGSATFVLHDDERGYYPFGFGFGFGTYFWDGGYYGHGHGHHGHGRGHSGGRSGGLGHPGARR